MLIITVILLNNCKLYNNKDESLNDENGIDLKKQNLLV